jgi:beta-lactamase class A
VEQNLKILSQYLHRLEFPAMRFHSLRLSLGLSGVLLRATWAQAQNTPRSLADQVKASAAEHQGDVALFAENLKTHETVAISPDMPVQTASVIKLAILYEALEQVRSGKAHFEDKITLTKTDQVPGSGVLLFFDAPLSLTLKDVLTMMIVMSDNSATNLVIDHLGIENINARIAKLGLKDTYHNATVPMLFIQPNQDRLVGLDRLEEMKEIKSSAEVEIVPGPHLLLQREPEIAAEVVARFARQC